MDRHKRKKLILKIMEGYDAGESYPLVGLDEFFDGNDDLGSIAPNLGETHPGLEKFSSVLKAVRDRDNVEDVLLAIHECPEPDDEADADVWPFAENVHIITSAAAKQVASWVSELKCEGVSDGWPYDPPIKLPKIPVAYGVRTLFWD